MIDINFVKDRRIDSEFSMKLISSAINNKSPYSFVRMNDGEADIIGAFREVDEERVRWRLNHWWGRSDYPVSDIEELREKLIISAESADILCFFDDGDKTGGNYKRCGRFLRKYADLKQSQHFSSPEIHYEWQSNDVIGSIVSGIDSITCITCYDIASSVSDKFDIKNVHTINIPGHSKYSYSGEGENTHWPHRFRDIVSQLSSPQNGHVYLVGAGVLGKYYCHIIKKYGGIAIDIGSVFDFWVGNEKRRSVKIGRSRVGI